MHITENDPSILLVEDDEQLAKNIRLLLETEGYRVTHVIGEKDALAICEESTFDCALVDLTLHDGSGFGFCVKIRKSCRLPIIFLTATADETSVVAGFEMGADDYIGKPFRPRELVARIKNVLRKNDNRYEENTQVLTCRNISLDKNRGVVWKSGREIYLSALEYRLLLVFLSNKEQLLSRERIADELWSISGEFISDNTINVYMKRLREKVEDDPQNPQIIVTVRGLGYKAVDE